ncbi:MAG TPA: hypothetical protein VIM16_06070 [Mucilaginibacter sp.]
MKVENPIAFSFIMQDDLYLLNNDKTANNINSAPVPVVKTQPLNFNFIGGNKKNFLIIVHYPELEFIEEVHLTALENILKRLDLNIDDAAIFNKAKYTGANYRELIDFFKPQKLLLLGKHALPDGVEPLALNKPRKLSNCNALFSFSFDEMMDNNENKKAFWEQMKQL